MAGGYQADVQKLVGRLLSRILFPSGFAAGPFVLNRQLPDTWVPIWASIGLLLTLAFWVLVVNCFESHQDGVCRRLQALYRRSESGARRYGLRRRYLLQAFAQYKLVTLAVPLLVMYFAAALLNPAGVTGASGAPEWVASMFACFGLVLTYWTKTTLAGCDTYSARVLAITRGLARDGDASMRRSLTIGFPDWLIRLEAAVACCIAAIAVGAAAHVVPVLPLAIASAVLNVIYMFAYHFFLVRAYDKARRVSPSTAKTQERVRSLSTPIVELAPDEKQR